MECVRDGVSEEFPASAGESRGDGGPLYEPFPNGRRGLGRSIFGLEDIEGISVYCGCRVGLKMFNDGGTRCLGSIVFDLLIHVRLNRCVYKTRVV